MRGRAVILVATALAAVLPAAMPADAAAKKRVVYGRVDDSFTITLKDAKGKPITRLAPGLVTFRIRDLSDMHNFHLLGPGFDRKTSVDATGRFVWKVRLKKGKWKFRCDAHQLVMHGSFVVAAPRKT
jgi:hypothetical protein